MSIIYLHNLVTRCKICYLWYPELCWIIWGCTGFDGIVEIKIASRGFRWPLKKAEKFLNAEKQPVLAAA